MSDQHAPHPRAPEAGATIGHYQIVAKVGEGGMGQVFRAHDPRLGRFVAVKVIAPAGHDNPTESTMRLVREARAASALNHPNIVTVYDIGALPDRQPETPFIVMEYIEGRTLREVIRERTASFKERIGYAVQVADALTAAHAAGIIHRDIKPANVMVNPQGLVKVLDFGLARHVTASPPPSASSPEQQSASTETAADLITRTGFVVGTFAYASPEQVEALPVDSRSDIFSFGVLLYELLTGVRPFEGATPIQLAASVLRQEPRPVTELCPEAAGAVEGIVQRCLQKKPGQRYQQMAEAKAALEEVRNAQVSSQIAAAAVPASVRRLQTALALVLAAAAGYLYWVNRGEPAPLAPLMAAPLTSYVGVERSASFSPDGSQFAFSWNGEDRNNTDIYVRPTREGRQLRLTDHAHADESPAWSPDGQYIAFRRLDPGFGIENNAKARVILIPPLGGAERVLAEGDIRSLRWTPDSREIAVSILISQPEEEPNRSRYAVEAIAVETGARRRLTDPPASLRGDLDFAFSPDGKRLAVMRFGPSPATDIIVMPARGGGKEQLLAHENVWTGGVAWTPDSKELIYASSWDGRRRLFRIAASDRAKPGPVAGIEPDASAPSLFPGSAGAAAALAFERHATDASIWRFDLTKESASGGQRLIDSTWPETSPSAAPDGSRLVFASMRSGISELWTADGTGRNQARLTHVAGSSGSPRWSPVDDRIVFDSFIGRNKEIFVIGSAGQNPVRLTDTPQEEARPNWSPDGKWVYFRSSRSGSAQIWRVASTGGGPAQQVTLTGGAEPMPSPDGQWLYYIRDRRVPQVWRVPAAGGGAESKFLDGPFYGYWGVTRDALVYLDSLPRPDGSRMVRVHDLRSGNTRAALRVTGGINATVPGLSVTPDGRSLLLLQVERSEADLFLVRPFH